LKNAVLKPCFPLVGLVVSCLFAAVPVAGEAALPAASDFGNPGDAPFVARQLAPEYRVPDAIRNLRTATTYDTLQAAIDDPATLDGDTLQLEVSLQPEGLVHLTKSIVLQGQTGSEVFQAGLDTGSSGDARGWFLLDSGLTLSVANLHFDGNGHRIWQAFRIKGQASFTNCVFSAIQYEPSTSYAGTAIAAVDDTTVEGCIFASIGRVGVLFFGTGVTAGSMSNCDYTGKGPGNWLDYMVEIGSGAFADIRNNVARGCRGIASSDLSESSGINLNTVFGPDTGGDLISNTLLDNTRGIQVGLASVDSSRATATYNRLIGNEFGIGINASTSLMAENNWFGCNEGPGQPGCDTIDGTPDVDPWLVLSISASPTQIAPAETSSIEASLRLNSDGLDTSADGFLPDHIPAAFTATLGTMAPAGSETASGLIPSIFTAGATPGTARVSVTVDNATVSDPVEIIQAPEAIPLAGATGRLGLILLLALSGLLIVWSRRN